MATSRMPSLPWPRNCSAAMRMPASEESTLTWAVASAMMGHAAVGQDLGRPDGERDDVHGQDVDALGEGPDEGAAAEAVAVADLLRASRRVR